MLTLIKTFIGASIEYAVKAWEDPKRRRMMQFALFSFLLSLVFAPIFTAKLFAADPFQNFFLSLSSWMSGGLGKSLAIIAFIISIVGAFFGRLEIALMAIIIAMLIAFSPSIINTFF